MTRLLLATVIVGVVLLGCFNEGPEYVTGTGSVVFNSFEGGFYGISDDNGNHWDPGNLPEQYKVDGLRVLFKAIVTDETTFHMWGRTVDLVSIRRLK